MDLGNSQRSGYRLVLRNKENCSLVTIVTKCEQSGGRLPSFGPGVDHMTNR